MLYLLRARGQFRLAAAVDDVDMLRAETQRRARRIHRDVAAADDSSCLAYLERRRVIGETVRLHEIAAREELIGGVYAAEALARDVLEPRQAGARADEDRVESLLAEELVHRVEAARHGIRLDGHTELLEVLDLLLHDLVLRQAELWNAVGEHAASLVQRLKNRDLVAALREIARAGKPGRAGADDRDALRIWGRGERRIRHLLSERPIRCEPLETADADRLALLAEDAVFLALVLLRADAAADRRQGVRLLDFLDGAVIVAFLDLRDERGDVYRDRAALAALRHLAVEAALRLRDGRLLVVAERDLLEIMRADLRRLHGHRMFLE